MEEDRRFYVYKHTFPNGKAYVGISSRKNPNYRYGNGGSRYNTDLMRRAIQKYGWENIQHEIIKSGITREEAELLEQQLIKEGQYNNSNYGYNLASGGHFPSMHEDTKKKLSIINMGHPVSDETRSKISSKHLGVPKSKEAKAKMSESKKGREPWNKGKKTPAETLVKLSKIRKGRTAPNKGVAMSDEQKNKISESKKGKSTWNKDITVPYKARKPLTDEQKKKISAAVKAAVAKRK